jgi:uncharacterized protein
VISFDPSKQRINLDDHGVDLALLDPFFDGALLTREDPRAAYGELRLQSVGWFEGELLFVVWTPRDDDWPHVISARRAQRHEREAWQRYVTR